MKTTTSVRQTKSGSKLVCFAALILSTVILAGCGKRMSGTYSGNAAPFNKITFTSGGKAEFSMMSGQTVEATYTVEGDKVKFSMGGQVLIYTIDKNGCLDGGKGPLGVFEPLCKQ